jgi:chromate transport protein ChrA
VYLGTLTFAHTKTPPIVGGILGFIGIFVPGITLAIAFQSLWHVLRSRPAIVVFLHGVNAGAVGLIFTAVYRIWQVGYLTEGQPSGVSLGNNPWWVAVAVIAYTSSAWFGVETFISILGGSVLGLCWYGVTSGS